VRISTAQRAAQADRSTIKPQKLVANAPFFTPAAELVDIDGTHIALDYGAY
jgi:hypothetical protein